jgi:hypothetical protein
VFLQCPDMYCCEGKNSSNACDGISPCARNRTGALCSSCPQGYTEVFGSPACVPDVECDGGQVREQTLAVTATSYLYGTLGT